jgi:GPI-anchor transamidase subunit U
MIDLGLGGLAMVELAMASYLSLYPALLLIPLIMLSRQRQSSASPSSYGKLASIFIIASSALLLTSYSLVGSWDFLKSTYGVMFFHLGIANNSLLLPDLTPNVGLWWYFFIEMFDSFRSFFLVVFQLHLLIYVIPLIQRLPRNALAIITTLTGIISIFKSYPSVSDLALYLSLLSLHMNIFSRISICVR